MKLGYHKGIEVLYTEYQRLLSENGKPEDIKSIREGLEYMVINSPYKEFLPEEIRSLILDPAYKSISDMEPKNDPKWEAFKDEMGIVNPPDSLEDIDVIPEEDE
ncbi:MAG: hypothetical protein KJ737_12980 [Proteobacteria bacterium]|nr:hypothetical protein [Pseudomonadota bacterium]